MQKEYKVSVIVNCFNGEKYLERCLKSIIDQTINNWEVIFLDNKSSDSSKKIFKSFNDQRFKYFCSPYFMKLYEARNEALKYANGDFIAFLDCDDWWEIFHLKNAEFFFNNQKFSFYFSNAYNYYEKKKVFKLHKKSLPKKNIFENLVDDYSVKISSLIIRKKILDLYDNQVFNKKFNIIGDYDLVMKIASKHESCSSDVPSVNCSFHGENYSLKNRDEYVEEFNYWFKNINFKNENFLKKKKMITDNIIYINLFREITKQKKVKNLIEIFKIKNLKKKIKLIMIFFIPKFLINKLLSRY